ncbi:hypothetical protein [Pseudonocardia acaciae]|uniref:hypothetical protein n=1 Tax=Pseudonocardia acaciae TaxID=551276 RepID=UPI00048B5D63|nr:hypothetical protein [Pseudonocardia acaciae]
MTRSTEHPAPGSDVPGAPPALTRRLTPADGVLITAHPSATVAPPTPEPVRPQSRWVPAALGLALAAVAVALGVTWRRRQVA